MREGTTAPRKIGELIPAVLRAVRPQVRNELYELSEAWGRAAGPDVARRSRVIGMNRDTLTVAVESAPLRQELETFRKPELLARVRAEFPRRNIANLRCVLRAT
ncbi:MAG: DUF721 domain-containing protein [Planctomycetes bacterium]|nr:DUF721 domain-containing protein [Planctomycetota bacterium]